MVPTEPIHLRPTAELAERVLLPGDPGRALALAQTLIVEPRMFNHHRGLWGYTGDSRDDGRPLTIQSTGMGGPSAAIVLAELIALGAARFVRVGTCGALHPDLRLGELVIASEAIALDGASRALGADGRVPSDPALAGALASAAPQARRGPVATVDLFYAPNPTGDAADALAIEMESASLFALGLALQVKVAAMFVVSDVFAGDKRTRIEDDPLLASVEQMGAVAVAALAG